MPAHGPIHLPVEEEDATSVSVPIVTTRGVAFEVLRTVSTASAFGLQVYSALCAKKFAKSHNGPHRFDVTLWSVIGTWQAQVAYAACLVSIAWFLSAPAEQTLVLCLWNCVTGRNPPGKRIPHSDTQTYNKPPSGVFGHNHTAARYIHMHRLPRHISPGCVLAFDDA
jgi:hypothetical protein